MTNFSFKDHLPSDSKGAGMKDLGICSKYRLYADGSLKHEDLFSEYDNSQPYCDDYYETDVPDYIEDEGNIIAYIETEMGIRK